MNISHDALKDLTAHPELKAKGDILERHSLLLLKGHAVSDRHDVPSLEGFRMALRVKRMGAWRKESCILVTAQADFYAVFFFRFDFGILKPIVDVFRKATEPAVRFPNWLDLSREVLNTKTRLSTCLNQKVVGQK